MPLDVNRLVFGPAEGRSPLTSLIVLHGFTMNGQDHSRYWLPRLRRALSPPLLDSLRIVFLTAPKRRISCYPDKPTLHAWHDYLTDHGGDEGRPDLEEEIDETHLAWCRDRIHAHITSEAELVGGINRVALIGESQGACVALDAALTYPYGAIAGVFSSFGMLYRMTPTPPERAGLHVAAFHGAADWCIGVGLAMRSYGRLAEAGFTQLRLHVEPALGHVQRSKPAGDVEMAVVARALRAWGLVSNHSRATGSDGRVARAQTDVPNGEALPTQQVQPPAPEEGEQLNGAMQDLHISTRGEATAQQLGGRQGPPGGEAFGGRREGARRRHRRQRGKRARGGAAEGAAQDER
jgi:predicted esterase